MYFPLREAQKCAFEMEQSIQKFHKWDANKIKHLLETPFFRGDTQGSQ